MAWPNRLAKFPSVISNEGMSQLLFFDCEFTDLNDSARLISAGFITASGDHYYGELAEYDEGDCNDFVKATVLPLLARPSMTADDFVSSLTNWVNDLGQDVLFVADSDWDQRILTATFAAVGKTVPERWHFQKTPDNFTNGVQRDLFNEEMAAFFLRNPEMKQHHALTDACAIRSAYLRAVPGN